MSNFQEYEIYLQEFLEYILGYSLLGNVGSSLLGIAAYVLTSWALYTIADRRGIKNPWLSWIPVVNCWIIGSLSDQYRYVVKGEVKNKRKTLLILNIISAVVALTLVIVGLVMAVQTATSLFGISVTNGDLGLEFLDTALGMVVAGFAMAVPILALHIAIKVVRYMAMYDIYTSCTPKNNVIFLVLSIIFPITEPFFLFFTRDQDEGMPPRRETVE
jgi:formate hydrogenlyase subunit 3/multisubunit Na+/H+ antiporter MnhD subunit